MLKPIYNTGPIFYGYGSLWLDPYGVVLVGWEVEGCRNGKV